MKDTAENNRLLAEFLGWKQQTDGAERWCGRWIHPEYVEKHAILRFDSSWDWIMPVVEEIEQKGFRVEISDRRCSIWEKQTVLVDVGGAEHTKLSAVYAVCAWFVRNKKREKEAEAEESRQEVARLVDVGMIDLIKAVQAGLPDFDGDFGGMLDIHIEDIKDDLVNLIAEAVENGK